MMEEKETNGKSDLYSKAVRAGKRTYFFDVKTTKGDEQYITLTESKRRFDTEQNRFVYEKHKIFLYKEDFEKVAKGLNDAVNFVQTGEYPEDYNEEPAHYRTENGEENEQVDSSIEKWFDELGKDNG